MSTYRKKTANAKKPAAWPFDLLEVFDIPRELILDLPRLTLIGDLQLLIENYSGLQHYEPQRIEIVTKLGLLRIIGTELGLSYISADELLVRGHISRLEYVREERS